jgi:hypothetical protein
MKMGNVSIQGTAVQMATKLIVIITRKNAKARDVRSFKD